MNPYDDTPRHGRCWSTLSGVLFVAFFLAGDVLRSILAAMPLPLPTAPATDVMQYYTTSWPAALAVGIVQILSAGALFVFAGCVADVVQQVSSTARPTQVVTRVAGMPAAAFLLVSALLSLALIPVTVGSDLALVGALRTANFLTGGTLHVAPLGLFVGAASLAACKAGSLPRWIIWWGIVQAVVAILSLASLGVFPAALLILLGRMIG
jgi:hypothetical protein